MFCKWNGDVVACPDPNTAAAPTSMCGPNSTPYWDTQMCMWECPATTASYTCAARPGVDAASGADCEQHYIYALC